MASMISSRAFNLVRTTSVAATLSRTYETTGKALGLEKVGLNVGKVYRNLSYEEIDQHEVANGEGYKTNNGTMAVDTGKYTGRSPTDKWIVENPGSKENVWWSPVPPNQPVSPEIFDELHQKACEYMEGKDGLYVLDAFCGASPKTRKPVRFVTEWAWHHHFVTNMFIRPTEEELVDFEPEFTIVNCSKGLVNDKWEEHGLNSDAFGGFNIDKRLGVILGATYGGEMKKGVFSLMNYWLPLDGILSMHCSANRGPDGDSAVFFGLSGTGKTTLSADPKRFLLGDDEHGWDDDGIFNFEGGCYAKTIDLSEENEPDIYNAIRPGALLENVWVDEDGVCDYYNTSKTENGRVSYPLHYIDNIEPTSMAGHPNAMVFLTCDAYGVLPPISKLSSGQAMYHFLSGYTAKVAGTERGILEPTPSFSACFGAAFLLLHPIKYATLLGEKLERHGTQAYLVNTGWTAGSYGVGHRMDIPITRRCIDVILDGTLDDCELVHDDLLNLDVPKSVEGIEDSVLHPRLSWEDTAAYDETAKTLAGKFVENFKQYQVEGLEDFSVYGPQL